MVACECTDVHKRRRVVLTGGPGAGQTALLELIRQSFCSHVKVLPEAASVVFGGGFPIDGLAYWPGSSEEFWSSLGTTLDMEFRRYDAVIHLRTPAQEHGYNHRNPLRTESAGAAADIDARIVRSWERHPHRFIVESSVEFLDKAARPLEILRGELPECCRRHVIPALRDHRRRLLNGRRITAAGYKRHHHRVNSEMGTEYGDQRRARDRNSIDVNGPHE